MRGAGAVDPHNKLQSFNQILVKENLAEICQLINVEITPETSNQTSISDEKRKTSSKKVTRPDRFAKKTLSKREAVFENDDDEEDEVQSINTTNSHPNTRNSETQGARNGSKTSKIDSKKVKEKLKKFI